MGRADGRKLLKWNAVPTIEASNNQQKRAKGKVPRRPGSEQTHDTLDAAMHLLPLLPLLPFAHSQVKHMEYDLLHWMAKLSQVRQVSVKHIKKLADIDGERDLKLAPHLKPAYLDQDHFAKMNVDLRLRPTIVLRAAKRVLVSLGRMEEEALTTAWFVERVYRWFTLMTSRYIGTAMSMFKPDAHDEAVAFLREFMGIFAHVSIKRATKGTSSSPYKQVVYSLVQVLSKFSTSF
ncbi:hypothetical protein HPB48_027013 [Haemaphysalis longicornis]|uniref:Uncharacterized protein n=1 Tax=Haemaphysalis longicornis TaxID=44386 RepID=A0A9J6H2Q8_HAELO|nr:hypothetical protein HPB48_027013 [Haemaphysalis longicornis]